MIKAHLQDSKFKSASMFTAFYNVHCVVEEVATLGTDRSHVSMHLRTKDDSIMVYKCGSPHWSPMCPPRSTLVPPYKSLGSPMTPPSGSCIFVTQSCPPV